MAPGFTFYYDLGSPYAWLVAERIGIALPYVVWQPVEQPAVDTGAPLWDGDRNRVVELADAMQLLPPRWPDDHADPVAEIVDGDEIDGAGVHGDTETREAMLVASFAKSIGRTVAFSLAAFRQIYNAGRRVDETDTLLLAAAACELHPRAILKALETASVAASLDEAGREARDAGVTRLPALASPDGCTHGDELLALALEEFASLREIA